MRRILGVVLCLAAVAATAAGQQFWDKKPWTNWDKQEVERLLKNSPWAQPQTLASVNVDLSGGRVLRDPLASRVKDRDYANVAKLTYTAQFRSAPVVRQALVRQLQVAKNYDALSPDQKKSLDAKTAMFLAPGDPSQIVVFVSYEVSVSGYLIELQRYWNAQTAGTLSSTVFLNLPGGHKLSLADYSPTSGGFQFLFQRPSEPLPEGGITLEFSSPAFNNIPAGQVLISFSTKKMTVNGATVF